MARGITDVRASAKAGPRMARLSELDRLNPGAGIPC
jgi:hypothetical protein